MAIYQKVVVIAGREVACVLWLLCGGGFELSTQMVNCQLLLFLLLC